MMTLNGRSLVSRIGYIFLGALLIPASAIDARNARATTAVTDIERASTKDSASSQSGMGVQLFDCIMRLPPDYLLRADAEPFYFYKQGEAFGTISIKPYDKPDTEHIKILKETTIGHLTVVQVIGTFAGSRSTLSYLHDNETMIVIGGDDEGWALEMAQQCVENSKPKQGLIPRTGRP